MFFEMFTVVFGSGLFLFFNFLLSVISGLSVVTSEKLI